MGGLGWGGLPKPKYIGTFHAGARRCGGSPCARAPTSLLLSGRWARRAAAPLSRVVTPPWAVSRYARLIQVSPREDHCFPHFEEIKISIARKIGEIETQGKWWHMDT